MHDIALEDREELGASFSSEPERDCLSTWPLDWSCRRNLFFDLEVLIDFDSSRPAG